MEKKRINTTIVADSVHKGSRITTFLLTYPRIIHAELMTHRVFSRNSASSRAIPFKKMVQSVKEDPFIPIAWQKEHSGMQGTQYITDPIELKNCIATWLDARDSAVDHAKILHGDLAIFDDTPDPYRPLDMGVTKQLCNRLLEPFLWHTVLVTTTELENFFELRCPQYCINWYSADRPEALEPACSTFRSKKRAVEATEGETSGWTQIDWLLASESGAEIHIQALAEAMWDSYKESVPKELETGEWHIPYGDKIDLSKLLPDIEREYAGYGHGSEALIARDLQEIKLKISVARAARLSYMTMDGVIDYEKDIKLHDILLENGHLSPFEHCAKAMSSYAPIEVIEGATHQDKQGNIWSGNFRGWVQYRQLIQEQQE